MSATGRAAPDAATAGAATAAGAGHVPAAVLATLARLQQVESRSDAVLRPLVERAFRPERGDARDDRDGPDDRDGLEARRGLVSVLAAAIGSGPIPAAAIGSGPAPTAVNGSGPAPTAAGTDGVVLRGSDSTVVTAMVEVMPRTVAWAVAHGMPEADAWRSVADVPRKIAAYGVAGTGVDWLALVATGGVVTVGRLQFERPRPLPISPTQRDEPDEPDEPDQPDQPDEWHEPGQPDESAGLGWGVHIPELGPLDPAACDAAFALAPELLARLWGSRAAWWTCDSWLLDPQLAHVLGPESNSVRFADRFRLLPEPATDPEPASAGLDALAKFVFRTDVPGMLAATPVGRLQAGVRTILDGGGSWHERAGIAPVTRPRR